MARRKTENTHTTISIKWDSKERFRKYARLVKETRNGQMHESDAVVFNKILVYYIDNNKPDSTTAKSTYPTKS